MALAGLRSWWSEKKQVQSTFNIKKKRKKERGRQRWAVARPTCFATIWIILACMEKWWRQKIKKKKEWIVDKQARKGL